MTSCGLDLVDHPRHAEGAYASLFYDALQTATVAGASDLHIEPTCDGLTIRMRVFGDMCAPWRKIGLEHRGAFTAAVKQLTGLEIGVSGRPQDGRLAVAVLKVDLRVSLLPTLYGEKVVLRLLDKTRKFVLDEVGFDDAANGAIKNALGCSDGVVLISGPTGSGKTTTLYTMLAALDPHASNIITLEDPVEYSLAGVNQVRITGKLGFASALRGVLRQDPDVILVGEIRDRETAELTFQAASTGHLVLSTIHANGAAEVIARLLGLGVERYLIESCLRFSGAQRLVKALCRVCAEPSDEATLAWVRQYALARAQEASEVTLRQQGRGCSACKGGITGRVPLLEYLTQAEIKSGTLVPTQTMAVAAIKRAVCGDIDAREVQGLV